MLQRKVEIYLSVNAKKTNKLDDQQLSPDEGKAQRLCDSSESCGGHLCRTDEDIVRTYVKA